MLGWPSGLLCLAVACVVVLPTGFADGQDDASKVSTLVRDLQGPDFKKAYAAAEQLRKYPQFRAQVVAGLIEAISTGD